MVPDQETSRDYVANFDVFILSNLLKIELTQKCIKESQNFLLSQTEKTQKSAF
jgi:hypothetical protein